MIFLQQFINGLALGGAYALVAVGFSILYVSVNVVNFAHGEIFMLGGMIAWFFNSKLGLNIYFSIIVSLIFCTLIGMFQERIVYRKIYNRSRYIILIATVGMSLFLLNGSSLIFGTEAHRFPSLVNGKMIMIGNIIISYDYMLMLGVAGVLAFLLIIFLNKSKEGMGIRAVCQDKNTSSLMGINVFKSISISWGIAAFLGATAGILMAPITFVSTTSGTHILFKGATAAMLGGIGVVSGGIFGGVLLGLIESLSIGFISSGYKDLISFAILIIVLVVKPTGILGKKKKGI